MARAFFDPGELRSALSLQAASMVADGQGGFASGWSEVGSLFALVQPVTARQLFAADQAMAEVTHRITIRARSDVLCGMRFTRGDRAFAIAAIHDPDEKGRYLVCMAKELGR